MRLLFSTVRSLVGYAHAHPRYSFDDDLFFLNRTSFAAARIDKSVQAAIRRAEKGNRLVWEEDDDTLNESRRALNELLKRHSLKPTSPSLPHVKHPTLLRVDIERVNNGSVTRILVLV